MKHHSELDTIRIVAIMMVIFHHFLLLNGYLACGGKPTGTPWTDMLGSVASTGGGVGLDMFLFLSSFLLVGSVIREYDRKGFCNKKAFYIRRCRRILPLYIPFVPFSAFVMQHIVPGNQLTPGYTLAFLSLFFGNWACVFGGFPASVAAPLWSISLQEQAYLVMPYCSPRRIIPWAIGGMALATAVGYLMVVSGFAKGPYPELWATTFVRLQPICLGMLAALYIKRRAWNPERWQRMALFAAGASAPTAYAIYPGFWEHPLCFYPISAFSCLCITGAVWNEKDAFVWKPLVELGKASYGIYVFHELFIVLVAHYCHWPKSESLWQALEFAGQKIFFVLFFTFSLALLSHHYYEVWFSKARKEERLAAGTSMPVSAVAV